MKFAGQFVHYFFSFSKIEEFLKLKEWVRTEKDELKRRPTCHNAKTQDKIRRRRLGVKDKFVKLNKFSHAFLETPRIDNSKELRVY